MDYNKEHIDNLFKKRLGDYAEVPPPAAWDVLEKRLDGANGRRVFFWPWLSYNRKGFLFVLLGALLVSSGALFLYRHTLHNMAAVHNSRQMHMPVAAQASNTHQANINAATQINTQDNIATTQTKITALDSNYHTKTTTHNKHSFNKNHADNSINRQPGLQGETTVAADDEKGKNISENVSTVSTQPVIVLAKQATNQGHIHIEQEVIEKHYEEKTKDILLASNAGGEAVVAKKHGIVVRSLPDDQIAHPQAIIYHSISPVQETVASTSRERVADRRVTNIKRQLPAYNAKKEPAAAKQAYIATINKPAVKKETAKEKESAIHVLIATKASPAQKKRTTIAAKGRSAKRLVPQAKPAIIASATKIADNKKDVVAKKKMSVPANSGIAQNDKPEKSHRQAPGKTERRQKQMTAHAAASLLPANAIAKQPTIKVGNTNNPTQAIHPKATVNNSVVIQSVPARTFNDMPTASAVKADIPLLNASGGASTGIDTATIAKRQKWFEYGVKAGYEGGFTSGAARKIVGAPYIQYNFGSRFSIMLQPAFKTASLSSRALNGSQTFYSVDQSSSSVRLDSTNSMLIIGAPGTPVDTVVLRYYSYRQAHSIVTKSYQYGGTYFEFELPLLAKYALTKNLSIYGGPDLVYGKTIDVTEVTSTGAPIEAIGSATTLAHGSQAPPAPPDIGSVITYTGTPLSGYKKPLYPLSNSDLLRLGYMLGASYELNKRYLFDALIEQSSAQAQNEGGYNVNKPLSSLYFRFTIGYRLSK